MFSSRAEVDRHVENALKKINSETERNLRCFSFAKLYVGVGDYEMARRHITTYLSVKPNSPEAYHLLGKIQEKLGKKEAALDAYRTSLQLDPNQKNLIIKVCEILADDDVNVDPSRAKYFYELAQEIDPENPIVYTLKEKIIKFENDDPADITKLLLKELEGRPTDVNLRIRLLRHFLQYNLINEAYKHAVEIEERDLPIFYNNLNWYETLAEILVKYQKHSAHNITTDWQFWFLSVSVLDKLASLTLDERMDNIRTSNEYVTAVFNFDQTLFNAAKNITNCPDRQLLQEFLNHYGAQLQFHLITLILKQAKKDLIKYKDAINYSLPLLFSAFHIAPPDLQALWLLHLPESRKRLIKKWHKEASFRCSQVGHILHGLAKDRKSTIIEKANQYSTGLWKEIIFKKLFITRDQQLKMPTSYFVTSNINITIRLPEKDELLKYDQNGQFVYPDSLHHHIWLALNTNLADYQCRVFDGLQYSVKNLKNCGAETLCVLDIEAFVYCAALSAQNLEEHKLLSLYQIATDKPPVLPAAITHYLGTINQTKFFSAAYKMFKNEHGGNMGELRLILIKGIEVVRCIDQHGLDVKLLITLANTFAERSRNLTKLSEIESNELRAELYWKTALPILEKLRNNQAITYPQQRYFNYKSKELTNSEICDHIENGKLFIGTQLMKKKEYEKALRIFELLKDPYASFYQAQIYKTMADQQINQNKENVTSEMRSQHIILLSRARDCLYLTLDRLREPSVDPKHPLNSQLGSEIEKIERLLSRIDPDCTNRNECDGMSDENVSSNESDHYMTGFTGLSSFSRPEQVHSTPHRYDITRREAKPSPERLDAQIRQLSSSVTHILEQNRFMVETNRTLADELRNSRDAVVSSAENLKREFNEIKEIKKTVSELKQSVDDELGGFKTITDMVFELKKEIEELKKDLKLQNQFTDEDIYGLTNEYADYNAINTNLYNPGRLPIAPAGNPLYPNLYPPMYPPGMYNYGVGLPPPAFGPQSITDFHQLPTTVPPLMPPLIKSTTASFLPPPTLPVTVTTSSVNIGPSLTWSSLTQPSTTIITAAVATTTTTTTTTKAPPVNVVITSSDPLPKTTPTTQPILSVTIPPQHIKGNKPHNYQIPLTTTATITSTPSILTKPPLVVSTESLLSNVAPPVYSAITTNEKSPAVAAATATSPSKNVSLGLQIEKSLDQTFNNNSANVSTSSISDEHDPCPDFKPLIPLPDEVPVTTGEENEIALFSGRAKLYRYVNKEWRERGIGILKILQNPQTKRIRILMRRDQVHKICANHFLTKDMILKSKTDRAYIWAAQDFADEALVHETLCVTFKTSEEATKFYNAFEDAKNKLPESPSFSSSSTSTVLSQDATTPPKSEQKGLNLGGFVFTSQPSFKPTITENTISTPSVTATTTTTTTVTTTASEASKPSPFAGFTFTPKPATTTEFKASTPQQTNDDNEDDFVPTTEFKPVIPLPELVEIKTGEENAEVLFETTAKLLRFDNNGKTKEWKERGTGIMKILKDTDKIRLLMRRDQVHKVCCNHQLLKNMEFKQMTNNNKAITWCAKDFSDGILKPETFCIKFKSDDLAKSFLDTIKQSKDLLDDNNCLIKSDNKKQQLPPPPSGFGDKFKPVKGTWECKNCYIYNDIKATNCAACDTPKSGIKKDQVFAFGTSQNTWGDAFKPKEGTWSCKTCMVRNEADKLYCVSCETPKNDDVAPKAAQQSEIKGVNLDTGGLTFNFGIPASTPPQPATTTTIPTKPTFNWSVDSNSASSTTSSCYETPRDEKFVFGSPQKSHDFEFTPRSPRRVSTGQKDDESDNSYLEEECDNIYFKPVIPLPDKVEIVTGEENEDVLYCHRAKLYRFTNGEWKERGIGDIKILKRKDNGKLRIVMRREQVHKICLNHVLTSDIEYIPKDEKTWLFYAPDYSEGEISHDQFCVRFKNAEIAQEFKKAISDALNLKDLTPPPSSSITTTTATTTSDKEENVKSESDDDVIFVSETNVTADEEKEAKELGLPPKFMSYRQLPDCNCEQCKKDDEYLKGTSLTTTTTTTTTTTKSTTSSPFGTAKTSSGGSSSTFGTPASFSFATPCGTIDSIKDLLNKPSLLSEIKSDTSSVFASPNTTNNKSIFGTPKSESAAKFTFGGNTTTVSPFGSMKTTNLFAAASTTSTATTAKCVFGNATTSTPGGLFGTVTTAGNLFATSKTNLSFGSPSTTTATTPATVTTAQSIFGTTSNFFATPTTTTTTTPPSIFGATVGTPTTTQPVFGSKPLFGTSTTTQNLFGSTVQPKTSNQSIFGTPSTPSTTTTSTSIFGTVTTTIFGTLTTTTTTTSTSIFGSAATSTTSTSIFDSAATSTTSTSIFGSAATSSTSIFGSAATSTSSTSIFGTATTSSTESIFGKSTISRPVFGSTTIPKSSTENLFGTPTTTTTTASIFGTNNSIFGGGSDNKTTATPIFGATPQIAAAQQHQQKDDKSVEKVTTNLKDEDKPVLDASSDFTFASLAAKVSTDAPPTFATKEPDENNRKPFAFLGAGAPVFGSNKKTETKTNEATEENGDESTGGGDDGYDPHYEPIVPLPDAIVVTTGEEDETILFNERAKLYRYDADSKEWKERGVGQMKILYHPVNNTYRFLLRREQIHKVVLNQLIIPDLDLQPMVTSDRAWVWAGYNYTDDGQHLEKLAIRFKSPELAQKFYGIVQECIEKVKLNANNKTVSTSLTEETATRNNEVENDDEEEDDDDHEEEDDVDEDEDDDEEDERSIMFMKRCTLFELVNDQWQQVALGDLQVYYDPEIYAARISMTDDSGLIVSNTLIGMNTFMDIENNSCTWKAVECCDDVPRWRNLKATFSSEAAAQEFHMTYLEGLNYAQQFDIVDDILTEENEEQEETES